jgi:hypothetical protein
MILASMPKLCLTHAHDRAKFLAFLGAFLGLAFLIVDDRNTGELLLFVFLLLGRHGDAAR